MTFRALVAVLVLLVGLPLSSATAGGLTRTAVLHDAVGVDRWADCDPIPYFINPTGAPAGWPATVAHALQQASRATGYTFVYAGAITARLSARSASASPAAPMRDAISFVWSDSRHAPYLPGEGADTLMDANGGLIRGAAVVLNTSLLRDRRSWVVPQVLLHEIGHTLGLSHVPDKREIMYPVQSYPIHGYQAGDLAGLRQVGRDAGPCVARPAPTPAG